MLSLFLVFSILLTGCANPKQLDGKLYDTYGVLDEDTKKNPNIDYQISLGNIVLFVLFSWTLVIPFYLGSFAMYEPVDFKDKVGPPSDKGIIIPMRDRLQQD